MYDLHTQTVVYTKDIYQLTGKVWVLLWILPLWKFEGTIEKLEQ